MGEGAEGELGLRFRARNAVHKCLSPSYPRRNQGVGVTGQAHPRKYPR